MFFERKPGSVTRKLSEEALKIGISIGIGIYMLGSGEDGVMAWKTIGKWWFNQQTLWLIWVNYNDLTATEPWNHGFYKRSYPKMGFISG